MTKLPATLPIGVMSMSLLLSACQSTILLPSVQGDLIGMQSAFMPTTSMSVSSLGVAPSAILVVKYAPSKKQNVKRAITAKGDAILYEDQENHTIAISLKQQTAHQGMAFYKNIDGVRAVNQN